MICTQKKRSGPYVGHASSSSRYHRDVNNLNMSVYIEEMRIMGTEERDHQQSSLLHFGFSVCSQHSNNQFVYIHPDYILCNFSHAGLRP